MELKRDQLVKALENAIRMGKFYSYMTPKLSYEELKDAIALIRELTEENEKIGIKNFDLIFELSRIKEETVRKMQERLKARYKLPQSNEVSSISPFQLHECIDRIAKELLEEGT
jgi:hypothetical protein